MEQKSLIDILAQNRMSLGPPPEENSTFQHWRLSRDSDDVAWLILDKADSSANTLSKAVLEELSQALNRLQENAPRGLVIRSAKQPGFCAGADIHEFAQVDEPDHLKTLIALGNDLFDRLERLAWPTVAVIHGHCLGGGLELALACDIRIAIQGAKFGFPEIRLGLHPGLGGTVRFTRLVNPVSAMQSMLTGRTIHTRQAKKLGLVSAITHERHVDNAVRAAVSGELSREPGSLKSAMLSSVPVRAAVAWQLRRKTAQQVSVEHYPAPFALIDLWQQHGASSKQMLEAETESFSRLMFTDTARGLIRAFFLREKLGKLGKSAATFGHIHVIGAGTMGADIAAWCAIQGLRTTLSDVDNAMLAQAIRRADAMARQRHLGGAETRDALDRLIPDPGNLGVAQADIIIEAGPETVDIKTKIYQSVEPQMKAGAILATNTSSIPLETLAETLQDPSRFVGIHFFNPVARMDLVEVVSHEQADHDALDRARGFLGRINKLPAPVKSAPGFLVNRCLTPYLMEAIVLVDEGFAPEIIDQAARDFGMPMGPLELADQVGLDICVAVADVLSERLNDPLPVLPEWLSRKIADGELGRKAGRGFYRWSKGKADRSSPASEPDEQLTERLVLSMLNACAACLHEGVVADADTLDAAMIFGTGFAPFRGGPMHYAQQRGYPDIARSLEALANAHGERFKPNALWLEPGPD